MKKIPFIKMHGAGNDFVFISSDMTKRPITPKIAKLLLDRHFGIGGDQLLWLNKLKLVIYNSDGSTAEMCGNGVRAVAYYLRDFKGMKKDFVIQTKAGPIGIVQRGGKIDVNMGRPILEGKKIPVRASGEVISRGLTIDRHMYRIHAVSMGNPHCVIFVNDVAKFPVTTVGPLIENHPFFPNRVNVEFVQVLSKDRVKARVWERGAGETLACGTGACAIAVAGARAGKTSRNVRIELPGGTLSARLSPDGFVYLSGPAETTYRGEFYV
jgi:diaminopimelate epimerase